MAYKIKTKRTSWKDNYSFTQKEIDVDNAIFEVQDKGTKEEKIRLIKILQNRTKILKNQTK